MITVVNFNDEIIKYSSELNKIPYVHEHMMTKYERQVLCVLACKSNTGKGIYEFGTWRGLTTHVLHCVTGQHIWTLDYVIPKDSSAYNPVQGNKVLPKDEIGMECKNDGNIDFLIMDSIQFKAEEHNIKDIDFCLVDGNHTYPYIKHDFDKAMKMVRSGGIIVIHDFIYGKVVNPNEIPNIEKGILNESVHDGVCHFVNTMSSLNWFHPEKTNFIYLTKD